MLLRQHGGGTDTEIGVSTKSGPLRKKIPSAPAGDRTRDLPITSPALYHCAVSGTNIVCLRRPNMMYLISDHTVGDTTKHVPTRLK